MIYTLGVLSSGNFFLIGLGFVLASTIFLALLGWGSADSTFIIVAGIFLLWGTGLILNSIFNNWKKVRLITWGKLYFGKLIKLEKSYNGPFGTAYFNGYFEFEYHLKSFNPKLVLPSAFEMVEGNHYLLIMDEDDPEKLIALQQFSDSFIQFFTRTFYASINQAKRNQHLS